VPEAHLVALVQHEGGGSGVVLPRLPDPVGVRDAKPRIGEEGKAEGECPVEGLPVRRGVDRDGHEVGSALLDLGTGTFQLTELLAAEASPVPAVEDEDDGAVRQALERRGSVPDGERQVPRDESP
jgi:hypothetical protein